MLSGSSLPVGEPPLFVFFDSQAGSIPACLSFSIVRVVSSRALLPCEGKIGLNG